MSASGFAKVITSLNNITDTINTAFTNRQSILCGPRLNEVFSQVDTLTSTRPTSLTDVANIFTTMSRNFYEFIQSEAALDMFSNPDYLRMQDNRLMADIMPVNS